MNIIIAIDYDVSPADKIYLSNVAMDKITEFLRKKEATETSGLLELEGHTRGHWILYDR